MGEKKAGNAERQAGLEWLQSGSLLSREQIIAGLQARDPQATSTTLNWRLHELCRNGSLFRIGRGRYATATPSVYYPQELPESVVRVSALIKTQFPYLKYSLFHTSELTQWMQHVPSRHFTVLEVEREGMESAFLALQDAGIEAFIRPDSTMMTRYVSRAEAPVLVQPLISEAPLLEVDGLHWPSLEKIVVDLVAEKAIYTAWQGAEQRHVFRNIGERLQVNSDRLARYAARRNRKAMLPDLLKFFQ